MNQRFTEEKFSLFNKDRLVNSNIKDTGHFSQRQGPTFPPGGGVFLHDEILVNIFEHVQETVAGFKLHWK